jgi:hypothetical protein
VGETRLVMRTAEQIRRSFPDGAFLVELAALDNADLLARGEQWSLTHLIYTCALSQWFLRKYEEAEKEFTQGMRISRTLQQSRCGGIAGSAGLEHGLDEAASTRRRTARRGAPGWRLSRRTAETHVDDILSKLGFSSRSQIANWLAARRRD